MGGEEEAGRVLAAKFAAIFPHLDERQRRLLMGAEARAIGHGGIRLVARAAGVREATVSLGVSELDSGAEPLGRARRPGGGRKRAADTDPGLRPALLALVEPDERGDPMSPLRWTTKSARKLAAELTAQGHKVSADTVGDLLRAGGFSLQGNAKTIEGKQHPDRDAQFRYINEQVKAHQGSGDPVISVDTKKKELVGQFKNAGREWRPKGQPVATRTHDFPEDSVGKAVPYGVYDITGNAGWVSVGTDHDTAAFAVESIRRWWKAAGGGDYPLARRLLITADAGGSNGYRTRAWKAELAALAVETGLEITVCHFPPGTSKWNKVEHRLFSHITMNWRGRPLASHEVIVQTIAATTTRAGLRVHAEPGTSAYDTGVKISDRQMDALPLTRHSWHGDWNYTLRPEAYEHVSTVPDPSGQPSPDLAWLCHPALTGLPAPQWDALIAALMTLHNQQRETSLDARRGHRPRLTAPGTGRRPSSPSPTGSWPPSSTSVSPCPRSPSPPCSASGPKRSTSASATSASSSARPDTPSSPDRAGSPAWMISTGSRPQKASSSHRRSRRRVNDLRLLTAGPMRQWRGGRSWIVTWGTWLPACCHAGTGIRTGRGAWP